MKNDVKQLSSLEHTMIGAMAGSLEVTIMQPTIAFKNALQSNRFIPTNPFILYRGLFTNILSTAPITATQFGTYKLAQKLTKNHYYLNNQFLCSSTAGTISALIASPAELMVIHQQKSGLSLLNQMKVFLRQYGSIQLFHGYGACAMRESIYAMSYLGLFPKLKNFLESKNKLNYYSNTSITLLTGILSGIIGSVLTHPFDTIKTRQQAFMYDKPGYLTMMSSIKHMYKENGYSVFWKGIIPRCLRIICAVIILNETKSNAVNYLEKKPENILIEEKCTT